MSVQKSEVINALHDLTLFLHTVLENTHSEADRIQVRIWLKVVNLIALWLAQD